MSILLRRLPSLFRPQRWIGGTPWGASSALRRLQQHLDVACGQALRCVDLSGHDATTLAEFPQSSIVPLQAHVDHLILPPGCTVSTVLRWTRSLALQTLTAHGVVPDRALRDQDLPSSLVLIHGDEGLLPADDMLRSTRLLELREPGARQPLHTSRQAPLSATAPVTIQDWMQAQAIVDRSLAHFMGAPTAAAQALEPHTLTADEVTHIVRVLRSFPTVLLPVRGRLACERALARLTEGAGALLTVSQARQLHIAITQARLAAIVPSPAGLSVADPTDLRWLQLLHAWITGAAAAPERREREAGVERDLMLRHQQLLSYTLDAVKPASPTFPPAAARPAASAPSLPAQSPSTLTVQACALITAQPSALITVSSSGSTRQPRRSGPPSQATVRCSAFRLRPRPGKAFRYLNVPVA
ncbi:hypothetical protein [Roseateles terrae]|uniref:Uncharacterized protein n=1 Tax=Roseateles terrae TaxID=431060 RepID=A0ABR6GWH4_9BURK|nr:hypothetical protein [Roseateles terrae]MBB3196455.1 hypothetical protein [Roseateles terrae]OWQ83320.1 hypothetical protein CDN98_23060 [Roseateles terrae]